MFFAIDPANGVAVYEQIIRQVKFAVARDAVKAGEMIPSVRELARELAVNPNTVARAYRQLQTDGVLASVRGTGLEVAEAARDRCRRETIELIRHRLRQVLLEAQQSQLSLDELRQLVDSELRALPARRSLTMQPAIRLANVTKRYGDQLALDRVSFEVPPGCVFALLGENGAGKTTAIRMLLGLAEPDSGFAEVLGRDSRGRQLEILRHVGYVPERPTLYDWMTVSEIGWFTAGFYGGDFTRHYEQLISDFALPADRKLKALSKGMRAKVALSLSLAHRPDVLLLDEPTSGLDTMVRREFLESMVDLAAAGRTVFLSSHQIHEVEHVADYVAILHQGHLVLAERLDDLKDSVRALTVTLDDGVAMPRVAGEILRERRKARQWQVLTRGMSDEDLHLLRAQTAVRDVETRRPSLEEIFVAYMRTNSEPNDAERSQPTEGSTR